MDKNTFAFGKLNFIICGIAVLIIIAGFLLMTGKGSSIEGGFDPDIFSTRRIVVAPLICFSGFLIMIGGIFAPEKWNNKKEGNR